MENISRRLNIHDASTIKKSEEFLRILQSKTSLKLSDQVKTIICLDIAASFTGVSFDKETALELCSIRKSVYENNLHNIKKILNVDKPLSISELCVQFSCTHLKETAERLYSSYRSKDNKIKDEEHPQYVAAAVYTICKLNKMKPSKPQFSSLSRLKPSQWNALTTDFEKFAISEGYEKSNSKSKKSIVAHAIINAEKENIAEDVEMKKNCSNQPLIEDYDVWKDRILKEAEQAIREGKD